MSDIPDDDIPVAEPPCGDEAIPEIVPATPEGERIAKAIARAGVASRRDVEAMIEAGRVTLNGKILASPAINVTDADRITVDGEPLPARERTRLWILHKPRGVVTTARDPEGRQTVFQVVPADLPRVVAIGRLDINTEGLLLLTNDGGLAKVIAHPDTGWLRKYRVRAFGEITQPELDKLRKGVTIDGMEYGPVEASLDRVNGDNVWLTLGLREGKNREVKRILEHLGLSVNRLIRLSFGPFQLGELEVGLVEEVRTKVLKEQLGKTLAEQAGVDFESPVREPIAAFGKPKKPLAEGQRAPAAKARKPASASSRAAPRGAYERPSRDPSRSAAPARVPTGGMSAGPRQSVWRADEDAERPRGTKIPRRGSDPRASRETAAERGRERVGAIKSGERRVLVERLQPSPEAPAPEPHRRVRFRQAEDRPQRQGSERAEQRPRRFEDRAGQPADVAGRGARPDRRPDERRDERRGGGRGQSERPAGGGGFRADKPAGGRPGAGRGFKPGGGGDRPGGGGFKAGGGRPGGFKGGKPGGRPGGAGGRPQSRGGGGRPPRAGK